MSRAETWDAIVVGAGPAGCAAAYDVAAAGCRVLLLDRAHSFPRAKACAGGLTMKAVRALRYPVTPVVRKAVAHAMLEHRSAPGRVLPVRRHSPFCLMTVRAELDAYCLEQTRARGAQFKPGTQLRGVEEAPGGVRVYLEGRAEPLETRYLLGADGVHSRVRAHLYPEGAAWFRTGFAIEADVPDAATRGRTFPLVFDFDPALRGYGWVFPRDNHVNVGLYTADGAGGAPDRAGVAAARLTRATLTRYIAERCGTEAHERAVGQFLGLGGAGYAPAPRARVLLAGDAAGLVDPLTGEGIYAAIASGQAAAAAMVASLRTGSGAGAEYRRGLKRQQADLAVSEFAAKAFYAHPERGFRLMRMPLVRRAVLHSYGEGGSLTTLARGLRMVRRVVGA